MSPNILSNVKSSLHLSKNTDIYFACLVHFLRLKKKHNAFLQEYLSFVSEKEVALFMAKSKSKESCHYLKKKKTDKEYEYNCNKIKIIFYDTREKL